MEKSDVVNSDSGKFEDSHERTSTGTFLDPGQDAVVAAVEKRVAQIAMVPKGAAPCGARTVRHPRAAAHQPAARLGRDA